MGLWVFIAAFTLLVVLVIVGIRKGGQLEQQRDEKFQKAATQLGWRFELKPTDGHRDATVPERMLRASWDEIEFGIEGNHDRLAWRLWYDRAHRFAYTSEVSPSDGFAAFVCESIFAPGLSMLILPRWRYKAEASKTAGVLEAVARAVSTGGSTADDIDLRRDFVLKAVEAKGTSTQLRDAYAILTGQVSALPWFDRELETMLLALPKPMQLSHLTLVARLDARGLRMDFQSPQVGSWTFWQQFARFGEGLASRLVKAGLAQPR